MSQHRPWWTVDKGSVHTAVLPYVQAVEQAQFDLFNRFVKLAALYDPNAYATGGDTTREQAGVVTENVIASNVDTVTAVVATADVRARFMTDDGDWSTQRTARHLEWYAEGLSALLEIDARCRAAFKDAAIKGTGLIKVYADELDQIRVERVMVDDIVVDERECSSGGAPRQMHQRLKIDREDLCAQFPDYEDEIRRSQTSTGRDWSRWADYRPIESHEVVAVESWRLPVGKKPGRHTIAIDGCDLLDEEWTKPFFPFARMVWSERVAGWYGISGAERIAGHQRTLNKRNWHIDRQLDQGAVPTTYVRLADANLAVKTINRIGTIAVVKGDYPQTVIPPAVSSETYNNRTETKASAFEEFGVSRMAAQSVKPAGIDSGVAMREYRDQTTQRFALQEKAYERLKLDVIWLALDCCKDLGKSAPVILKRTKFGSRKIPWSKVDMSDVRVSIAAAATLSRTPAGRTQTVLEWAQAGVISQDEARRLMRHPDLEQAMSLYTAALESIEEDLEMIEDGETVMPEPFTNLKMAVWRGQMRYLDDRGKGAPEGVLEGVRQYVVQAAHMLNMQAQPAQPGAMPAGDAMGMAPEPTGPAPQAALAPQAMQLRAM